MTPDSSTTTSESVAKVQKLKLPWFGIVLLTIAAVGMWQGWAWWRWAIAPPEPIAKKIQLQIPVGTSSQQIGRDLERVGIIHSQFAWRMWSFKLQLLESSGSYKAGTYELPLDQPLPAIANTIWQGEVVQNSITIPEGWSIQQMATYFQSLGWFSAEEFRQASETIPTEQFPWLPANLLSLEGFLYPDTYYFSGDSPQPELIIEQMLQRFAEVALPLYDEAKVPLNLNLQEWVTLASIVEKESVVGEERETIAGVFVNRLEKGMRLETDPTVEYALNIRQTKEQPLTLEQIRTPSPYNTYLNAGLPPTAIAAPGVASLKAALNPAETEYLFFVARYDGTHVFSKTLSEHEAATREIRAAITE